MTSKEALEQLIEQGLEVGSKVRVTKKTNPSDFGDTWISTMDNWIGKVVTVKLIKSDYNKLYLVRDDDGGWHFPATSVELVGTAKQSTGEGLLVNEEFVKQAHQAACSEWKRKIEKQFPGLFPYPGYFKFEEKHTISTVANGPLAVAYGIAPRGAEYQCLYVSDNYELIVREHDGYQLLFFKEK